MPEDSAKIPATKNWLSDPDRVRSQLLPAAGGVVLLSGIVPALNKVWWVVIAVVVVTAAIFVHWWRQMRVPFPVVMVSPEGILPHGWAISPIPWSEVRRTRFETQRGEQVLVIETSDNSVVRAALKPMFRVLRALSFPVGEVSVPVSLLADEEQEEFVRALRENGFAPD